MTKSRTRRDGAFIAGLFRLVLPVLLLWGCAAGPKVFVSPGGDVRRCPEEGGGLLRGADAERARASCISAARSAGYLEAELVGAVGITVADLPEGSAGLRILNVVDGSPASRAGIVPGDFLLRVRGLEVRNRKEAKIMMFGRVGTRVAVTLRKRGETVEIRLVRESVEQLKRVVRNGG